jgi:hypothetical protein
MNGKALGFKKPMLSRKCSMKVCHGEVSSLVHFVRSMLASCPSGLSAISNHLGDIASFSDLRNCREWCALASHIAYNASFYAFSKKLKSRTTRILLFQRFLGDIKMCIAEGCAECPAIVASLDLLQQVCPYEN